MRKNWWQSRTFWGALIVSSARVILAPTWTDRAAAAAEGVGVVLGAVGVRDAIAKNGRGE